MTLLVVSKPIGDSDRGGWLRLAAVAVMVGYFYVFMEWLFFVTKPSFLSALSLGDSLAVLMRGQLFVAAGLLTGVAFCWVVGQAVKPSTFGAVWLGPARAVPALVLTGALLLLVDNFTLTVLALGIRSSEGPWMLLYAILLLGLSVVGYRTVSRLSRSRRSSSAMALTAVLLPTLSLLTWVADSQPPRPVASSGSDATRTLPQLPNILLLSSDGLNAEHMSAYGYRRETTPFLQELAEEALVCENAFSNAGATGASMATLWTGKLPTRTRLIYPPDILRGEDSYQHLPLLLRNRGYSSLHLSMRHYSDPYDLNLRESFDAANFREGVEFHSSQLVSRLVGQQVAYFLEQLRDRIESRLLHILIWKPIENPYQEVLSAKQAFFRDSKLLKGLYDFLDENRSPFFAQLHLMGTHGGKFRPRQPHFSRGKTQDGEWMADFYDDAIRDFDHQVREIVERLKQLDVFENTVLVIHSDHAQLNKTDVRVPLIFRFPEGRASGRIAENTQLLDVPPTLLDYLGLPVPEWMDGRSLLSGELDPLHPVFSVRRFLGATMLEDNFFSVDYSKAGPPFHSLGAVRATVCQRSFFLELREGYLVASEVAGHTSPCDPEFLPTPDDAEELILGHLAENGYDVSQVVRPVVKHFLD